MHAIPVTRGQQAARSSRRSSERARRTGGRPRRLHLRGRRGQPHRQPAAVQARVRADRRRASTCRSSRCISIASGAASSASSAASSSGSCRSGCPTRSRSRSARRCRRASTAAEVRLAIMELGRRGDARTGARRPICCTPRSCASRKRRWRRFAMADSTGQTLTLGRDAGRRRCCSARRSGGARADEDEGRAAAAGVGRRRARQHRDAHGRQACRSTSTSRSGRKRWTAAIAQAGITTILTSQQFLAKASIEPSCPGMVFLEDLREDDRPRRQAARRCSRPRCCPSRCCGGRTAARAIRRDALATIIFSSGSTGVPKGVMLTHANMLANVDGARADLPDGRRTTASSACCRSSTRSASRARCGSRCCRAAAWRITRTRWTPRPIGELAGDVPRRRMLISTPTFCQAYLRRCTPEQFAHLQYAIVGAEKLREPLATAFQEQFGVDAARRLRLHGDVAGRRASTGRTSMHGREPQVGTKPGSVGHPIPGVAVKVVDQDTGEGPLIGRRGPAARQGPEPDAGLSATSRSGPPRSMRDGWYVTGDIGDDRRGRLHLHHRSAVALQQDRRRDGAAHQDRGSDQRDPRRDRVGGHRRARRRARRAARRVLHDARTSRPTRCGSGCARRICRGSGCRSASTCCRSRRFRRSARARSTCGASNHSRMRRSMMQ